MGVLKGTRWPAVLREAFGSLHRELRISLTPVPRPEKWVFVVGCYQSGKTLLVRLLARHRLISVLPEEGQFLTDQFQADYELGLPRMWVLREDVFRLTEADPGPDVLRLKKEWGMRLNVHKPVLVEESPPNAARTRWLQKHFENSHFLAIVRNGYAVAEAIRRKARPKHRQGWPIEYCARQWARSNEIILDDSPHLERLLWVKYEDLTERPQEELERILRFLGLDPEELDFSVGEPLSVHERNEPLCNLNEDSIARLIPEDIATISRLAAPILERFGYPVL